MARLYLSSALVLGAFSLTPCSSRAAFHTWTGASPATNNWNDVTNWKFLDAPNSDGTDVVIFPPCLCRTTSTVNVNHNINALVFVDSDVANAPSYTVNGSGRLQLYDSVAEVSNYSVTPQTVSAPLLLVDDIMISNFDDHFPDNFGKLTINSAIDLNGTGLTVRPGAKGIVINGVISGAGRFEKFASGVLTLSGANTYTGTTQIYEGTLRLGNSNVLPNSTTVELSDSGTLDLADHSDTIRSLKVSGPGPKITADNDQLLIAGAGDVIQLSGAVNLTDSDLYFKLGASTADTGVKTTGVSSGPQQVAANLRLGSVMRTINVSNTNTSGIDLLWKGVISETGGIRKLGAGTLELTAANSYGGGTIIEAGTLKTGADEVIPPGQLILRNGTLDVSGRLERVGPGSVNQTGLILGGVAGGSPHLQLGDGGDFSVSALGAFIEYDASNDPGTATISGGATSQMKLLTASISRDFVIGDSAATTEELMVDVAVTNGAGAHPLDMRKLGDGRLVFAHDNSFLKGFGVVDGALEIRHPGALGLGGSSAAGTDVTSGGSLELSGGISVATEHLTLRGPGHLGSGALRSTAGENTWGGLIVLADDSSIAVDVDSLSVTGVVSGSGQLTKTGAGSLMLTAANTFEGGTSIDEGTLHVNNASGSATGTGSVTVGDGGTLEGSGFIDGDTTVERGGTIAPGASIGQLALANVDFNPGSKFAVELAGDGAVAGTDYDQLVVSGAADLGGPFEFSELSIDLLGDFLPDWTDSFTILTAGSLSGGFRNVQNGARLETLASEGSFRVNYGSDTNVVVLSSFVDLPGDYNDDGMVDAADYVVWRKKEGAPAGTLPNDVDGGEIGDLQYLTWLVSYGNALSPAAAVESAAVPEPTSIVMFIMATLASFFVARPQLCR